MEETAKEIKLLQEAAIKRVQQNTGKTIQAIVEVFQYWIDHPEIYKGLLSTTTKQE